MDAGTAAFNSRRSPATGNQATFGNNNQPVHTHQQFYQQQVPPQQQPFPQQMQYGSDQDLVSPSYTMSSTNTGSRKPSLTSQSAKSMNKLFRRNRGTVDPSAEVQFDEETGADIQDITGNNVSFDDITHIRDRGPYGMNGAKTLDTTPIIPTLGNGGNLSSHNMSNIQYRKQMNHQMKMNLANGARAMSLAGSNPMSPNNNGAPSGGDPRAMSFNSFSNGPRTMSLNPSMSMQNVHLPSNQQGIMPNNGGPRAMSLNNRSQPYNNGPRSMSLRNGPPPPAGYGQMPANSMAPIPQGNSMPQGMPRSMSLNAQSMMHPGQMPNQMPMPNGQMQMNQMQMNQMQMNPQMNQQMVPGQMPNGQMMPSQMNQMNGQHGYSRGSYSTPLNQSSNDSLMNVVEEEDEQMSLGRVKATSGSDIPSPPLESEQMDKDTVTYNNTGSDENDENDMVYKFEHEDDNDNVLLSRKSTLKKSNSMRLRKLNLFNNKETDIKEEESYNTTPTKNSYGEEQKSPSFNMKDNYHTDTESLIKSGSDELAHHLAENKEKFNHIGANASNASNVNDVYYTANDLNSPTRTLPSPSVDNYLITKTSDKKESPLRKSTFPGENSEGEEDEEFESDYENDDTLDGRGSPKAIPKQSSIRSLTENTAFHNFRQNSLKKQDDIESYPKSVEGSENRELTFSRENYNPDYSTADTSSNTTSNVPTLQTATPDKVVDNTMRSTNVNDLMESPIPEATTPDAHENSTPLGISKKDSKRGSRSFSISSTSKSIFKRLSKSGSKRSSSAGFDNDGEDDLYNDSALILKRNSVSSTPRSQQRRTSQIKTEQPIAFSKEELGIMTANNDLLNELELVTTELASSIKRELKLESQLRTHIAPGNEYSNAPSSDIEAQIREKLKTISDLEEKLTKERRLRFISEEHALLSENGQTPSPLKLNYEKTELYRQLLIKNDLCHQLEDKLNEYQEKETREQEQAEKQKKNNGSLQDPDFLDRFNDLLKENAELKLTVIPDLEKKLELSNQRNQKNSSPNRQQLNYHTSSNNRLFSLVQNSLLNEASFDDDTIDQSEDQIEISSLKNQRNELREVITKLNSTHTYEMKLHQDKLRSMENKLQEQMHINEKLRERFGGVGGHGNTDSNGNLSLNLNSSSNPNSNATSANNSTSNLLLGNNKGGKLQGFSIVSPDKKLFDD